MFEEVERLWHEHFNGASKVEALSWPSVELPGNGIEFGLRESGKVGALGEMLAEKAVGVFVDAALPWAVRIGKENFLPGGQRQRWYSVTSWP